MTRARIGGVRWHEVRVSAKTVWSFVELVDSQGSVGTGEATLGGREARMREALARFEPAVLGHAPPDVDLATSAAAASTLPEFAVLSALDQARWDLAAQAGNVALCAALGERRRDKIPVYANINRGIATRTAEGFAMQARRAVADGFAAIKIAPFDGVELYGDERRPVDARRLDAGLARIAAVRDAIGPGVSLMVDCHWRLNRAAAKIVLEATAADRLHWLECPLPESPETLDALRQLRASANERGVKLAGCEEMSLLRGFEPYLRAGAYDVMMPDAKYVGGLCEMLAVAEAFERHGVGFSPHNPSGPVCHAASLHVCAVAPALERLEMQYAETPLFDDLVDRALPRPIGGAIGVPRAIGLGVRLNEELVRALRSPAG